MQSEYPLDLVRLRIEASLQVPLRQVPPPLTTVRWPCRLKSQGRLHGRVGTISFRSSSRFPLIAGERVDNPVTFPPGRARLVTNPWPTGSTAATMTMGIVLVASLAARVAPPPPPVTMTSTFNRTNSAERAERRSSFPSACRYSMTMFFPSTYPSSRRPWRNASIRAALVEGKAPSRYPIREIFVGSCA